MTKEQQPDDRKQGLFFIVKVGLVYVSWKVLFYLFLNVNWLNKYWETFNDFIAKIYVDISASILTNLFGYQLLTTSRNILIKDTAGLYVGNHCLGIAATYIFTVVLVLLEGKAKHKLWFIPLGIFGIFLINLIRAVALGVLLKNDSPLFAFNHSYTYVLIVYSIIFAMIMLWEKKIKTWK